MKGRRSHPPHVNKIIFERINKKEYRVALISAIAATASKESVALRGHKCALALPLIVDNSFESATKTAQVYKLLSTLFASDLVRAETAKARTGVRKRKGGRVRAKSAIIIVSKDSPAIKASRNIAGVDIVPVSGLSVEKLAPGAKAGRLAVYTEAALAEIAKL